MSCEPRDSQSWSTLAQALAGSFAARARGLLTLEFVLLNRGGEELGRLHVHGPTGAELEAGDLRAAIERSQQARYSMLTGGTETLAAEALGTSDILEIWCGGRSYEAHLSLLRNTAVARSSSGKVAARVTGGMTTRHYEAFFDTEDEASLPVAVFLLYYTVTLRSRAYRTGAIGG